jgi:dolichyl-phosphate beta-glucosyltransferase
MSAPFLSIVIPAYNEAERLGATLQSILDYVDARKIAAELIVVDDGSSDGTAALVEARRRAEKRLRLLPFRENRGKGAAVREGALAAEGGLVLVTDADLSTPIEELDRLLLRMRETASDVVIGSRGLAASRIEIRQPFWRERMGKVFNRILRALTPLRFRDTQCGFKLFDREKALPVLRKMVVDRFAFDVELLWLAQLAGLRILEEPVIWRNSPDSRVAPLSSSWNMLSDVLRLRRLIRRGFYRERERERAQEPRAPSAGPAP